MRISVWLKSKDRSDLCGHEGVSIRRADLCLVEAALMAVAVIVMWVVSIRRADLCLVEGRFYGLDLCPQSVVSIRRADLCLVEALNAARGALADVVSIRRADLCLVEVWYRGCGAIGRRKFQSAVRISVWLKCAYGTQPTGRRRSFNPPCGSLFG